MTVLSRTGRALAKTGVDVSTQYTMWNEHLLEQAKTFASETPKASISLLSSHTILSALLEEPKTFGLRANYDTDHDNDEDNEGDESPNDLSAVDKGIFNEALASDTSDHSGSNRDSTSSKSKSKSKSERSSETRPDKKHLSNSTAPLANIWEDELHVSEAVHNIFARSFAAALSL